MTVRTGPPPEDTMYLKVRQLRDYWHYTGQDCSKCPGRKLCVDEYDVYCAYPVWIRTKLLVKPFPCGLRPWSKRSLLAAQQPDGDSVDDVEGEEEVDG